MSETEATQLTDTQTIVTIYLYKDHDCNIQVLVPNHDESQRLHDTLDEFEKLDAIYCEMATRGTTLNTALQEEAIKVVGEIGLSGYLESKGFILPCTETIQL